MLSVGFVVALAVVVIGGLLLSRHIVWLSCAVIVAGSFLFSLCLRLMCIAAMLAIPLTALYLLVRFVKWAWMG
jgi:hypothetical protein